MILFTILSISLLGSGQPGFASFSKEENILLDEIEQACFQFFWMEADPHSGLVRDKTGVEVCSVASLGFSLAALPIGVERGYITHSEAKKRTLRILHTLESSNARHEGMFCHYIDLKTGHATTQGYESGASSVDTALLIAGAITAGEYFGGEIKEQVHRLYAQINWKAFVEPESRQVYMIWTPETWGEMKGPGHFDKPTWDWYSDETLLISLLGCASPRKDFRLEIDEFKAWLRKRGQYRDVDFVISWTGTLFTYMFAQCYYDFSRLGPDPTGVDWSFNTAMAVRANRDWCREQADKYPTYGRDRWGITAGSGPGDTYVVPGHQPRGADGNDPEGGTLHPYGAGMSLPFARHDAIQALKHMRSLQINGKPLWQNPAQGGYGFPDGFNLDQNWISDTVIGIAHGPMLMLIENARTGLIWNLFMSNPSINAGIDRIGMASPEALWPSLDLQDRAYLSELAEDTWQCIASFVNPKTGLPYDTSQAKEYSSVTNLGYYVACCAVAAKMDLISHREAVLRCRRVLDAYEKFEQWKGWSQSWNSVKTFKPMQDDPMVSVLDSGNMVAGFILGEQALPEIQEQVERIINKMDWNAVYDEKAQLLYGGYNMKQRQLASGWHVGDYAGDGRMAAFLAIAFEAAPKESWEKLNRETEEHFGLRIYRPGWLGGGLFMQSQDGLFLKEQFTPIGRSTANFAYAQMMYARLLGLDAWGWSACWSPDKRYLGYGGLEVPVITPHAAGMAAMYYPHQAVECLKILEGKGVRKPWKKSGKRRDFGFRDSINLETGKMSNLYLPCLDQAMLFLSLANTLEEGLVQDLFITHPAVQRGMQLIDEYTWPVDQGWLSEIHRRDREPIPFPDAERPTGKAPVLIDNFEIQESTTNRLNGKYCPWTRDAKDDTLSITISYQEADQNLPPNRWMQVEYDVDSPNPSAFGGLRIELANADGSACNALQLGLKGTPDSLKIELHGSGGIGTTYLKGIAKNRWNHLIIPFSRFGGMITDWSNLHKIEMVFEDTKSKPKHGFLYLDNLALVRVSY